MIKRTFKPWTSKYHWDWDQNNPKSILPESMFPHLYDTAYWSQFKFNKDVRNILDEDQQINDQIFNPKIVYDAEIFPDDNNNHIYDPISNNAQRSIVDEKNWLYNWYNHPTTKSIIQNDDSFKSDHRFASVPDSQRYDALLTDALTTNFFAVDLPSNYKSDESLGFYAKGSDDNSSKFIWLNPTILRHSDKQTMFNKHEPNTAAALHEYNHAVQDSFGIYNNEEDASKPYELQHKELHSGLMSFRKGFGLTPDKRDYSEKEVMEMINIVEKNQDYFSQHYPDIIRMINYVSKYGPNMYWKLADMLNTWAQNDVLNIDSQLRDGSTHNNASFIKLGGKLKWL